MRVTSRVRIINIHHALNSITEMVTSDWLRHSLYQFSCRLYFHIIMLPELQAGTGSRVGDWGLCTLGSGTTVKYLTDHGTPRVLHWSAPNAWKCSEFETETAGYADFCFECNGRLSQNVEASRSLLLVSTRRDNRPIPISWTFMCCHGVCGERSQAWLRRQQCHLKYTYM